jgi:hypothetical protein
MGQLYNSTRDKLVIEREALEQWYTFQAHLIEEEITPPNLLDHPWNMSVAGRSIYHDTVSHGRVLFWIGGMKHWPGWANNYVAIWVARSIYRVLSVSPSSLLVLKAGQEQQLLPLVLMPSSPKKLRDNAIKMQHALF